MVYRYGSVCQGTNDVLNKSSTAHVQEILSDEATKGGLKKQ